MDIETFKKELGRCLGCKVKPCTKACPLGVSPHDFITAAKSGNYAEAAAGIAARNPLPQTCGLICPDLFCQKACIRARIDAPIEIPCLQAEIMQRGGLPALALPASNGKKAAVVGGGPGGLGALYELIINGWHVDLYEKSAALGGAARLIPERRLPQAVLEAEISRLVNNKRVTVRLNTEIADYAALNGQYDGVILALGEPTPRTLGIKGEEYCLSYKEYLATAGHPDIETEFLSQTQRGLHLREQSQQSSPELHAENFASEPEMSPKEGECTLRYMTRPQRGLHLREQLQQSSPKLHAENFASEPEMSPKEGECTPRDMTRPQRGLHLREQLQQSSPKLHAENFASEPEMSPKEGECTPRDMTRPQRGLHLREQSQQSSPELHAENFASEPEMSPKEGECTLRYMTRPQRGLHLRTQSQQFSRAAVVGGGEVALDCALSLKEQGIETVEMFVRRQKGDMRIMARGHDELAQKNILVRTLTSITEIARTDTAYLVTAVQNRITPEGKAAPLPETEMALGHYDAIIMALGSYFPKENLPQNFICAGDMAGSAGTVVQALASGRAAAQQLMAEAVR